ncbi:phosphatidylserine decarboxylase [Candidatus Puniceispirillum marinum]|uniref:Phosphatidylserine decarboxylase related protein n=1 Tax=Puniceispirillum marinum (strain IMCC1322) TaxID=488538 RepID=D5BNR9_PUNMI|nr:phosphatidylserine decarboxylase [Candidatus Puniceispirillum marinum]ADE38336.1 phosphatidylserine decarboxylase related protein [Candidatus Puniceispirillum marinum IMCC1322]
MDAADLWQTGKVMMANDSATGLMASGRGIFGRIADDGWMVVAVAGGVTIVLSLIYLPLGTFALGLTLWFAHIMRMPERQRPDNDAAILAPADGVIVDISDARYPSPSLPQDDLSNTAEKGLRVTIRTSLADMQWQCNPVSGRVLDNLLIPGQRKHLGGTDCFAYKPAFDKDVLAAIRAGNERREVRFLSDNNRHVTLVQLATASARKLVCRLPEGKHIKAGDSFGMSHLAGLIDLFVPSDHDAAIAIGQHCVAGETILALPATKAQTKSVSITDV